MMRTAHAVFSNAVGQDDSKPGAAQTARTMVALLTDDEVKRLTGLGRSWRYRLSRQGKFPMPVKVGLRRIAYRSDEIEAWINTRTHQEAA
jgi:prophage regulatory protein